VNLFWLESSSVQERSNTFYNFVPTIFAPFDTGLVHFVNNDNKLLDSHASSQLNVLTGLTFLLESSFVFSLTGRNDKTTKISKRCTLNHVSDIVLMSRSIKNSDLFSFCVEKGSTHFSSFTLCFFIINIVHDVSEPPRVTALFFSFDFILFNDSLVDNTHL